MQLKEFYVAPFFQWMCEMKYANGKENKKTVAQHNHIGTFVHQCQEYYAQMGQHHSKHATSTPAHMHTRTRIRVHQQSGLLEQIWFITFSSVRVVVWRAVVYVRLCECLYARWKLLQLSTAAKQSETEFRKGSLPSKLVRFRTIVWLGLPLIINSKEKFKRLQRNFNVAVSLLNLFLFLWICISFRFVLRLNLLHNNT